jgi:hypothetical protein
MSGMIEILKSLFDRDLQKLKLEIESYQDEQKIWYTEGAITNPAGNLCLHLVGNLNTYIGKELGKTGYVRFRDAEFSLNNIPRAELISKIEGTISMVDKTLSQLKEQDLKNEFPGVYGDKKITIEELLLHTISHFNYHLGQVNYHRRLLDKPAKS